MNKRRRNFFALLLCLASLACNAACASGENKCEFVKPPVSSATILNAIGDGKIQLLVGCGLDPNQEIPIAGEHMTPLQFVAAMDRPDLIRQVVTAGADPNFSGSGDAPLPPLELALSARRFKSAEVLMSLGAKADYALSGSKMNALMELAFDDREGFPAGPVLDLLIKNGAQIDGADAKGNTPLHWGARSGNGPYVQALLTHGANACVPTERGERPADVVRVGSNALKRTLIRACEARQRQSSSTRESP